MLLLGFGVLAAPIAWGLALVSLYAIATHNCFPGEAPLQMPLWNVEWLLATIACVALLICIGAGALSYWSWRDSYHGNPAATSLVLFGEGRTRFLSIWGALTSLLFAILMVISLVGLFMVPSCGS